MAEFNPQVGQREAPDFTRLSRPNDRPQVDRSMETLFAGLGEAIEGISTVWDDANKNDIYNQLSTGVDQIRSEVGVDTATQLASEGQSLFDANSKLPGGADKARSEVQRLTNAFNDGQLSDSYYWGRVNSLAKQVRTQYPGYRREIDETIASITGSNPANALRTSVQREYEASLGAQSAQANRFETFVNQNLDHILRAYPDYFENPGKYSPEQVRAGVGASQLRASEVQWRSSELELALKENRASEEQVLGEATYLANSIVQDSVGAALNVLGSDLMGRIRSGQPLSSQDREQLTAAIADLQTQGRLGIRQTLNQQIGDSGQSIASILKGDATKLKAIEDNAIAQIEIISDMLLNDNVGLAGRTARLITGMKEQNLNNALKNSDALQRLQLANELGGQAINILLQSYPELVNESADGLRLLNLSGSVTPEPETIDGQLQRMSQVNSGQVPINQAKRLVTDKALLLTSPDLPIQAKVNVAQSIFREGNNRFVERFPSSVRKDVFLTLVSPEMTKAMGEVQAASPEAFDQYRNWALDSWQSVVKAESSQIQAGFDDAKVNMTFDEGTMQFKMNFTPEEIAKAEAYLARNRSDLAHRVSPELLNNPEAYLRSQYLTLGQSVDAINQTLKVMKPLLGDGREAEEAALGVLGIKPENGNQEGFFRSMYNAIKGALGPEGEESLPFEEGSPDPQEPQELGDVSLSSELVQLATYTPEEVQGARPDQLVDEEYELVSLDASAPASSGVAALRDFIGKAEAPKGYNQIFGRNREAPLDQMTVQEVLSFQRQMVRGGSPSSAVGKYQFIRKTLAGLVQQMGLSGEEKFTPELQDKLADALLRRRGLDSYLAGNISLERFQNNLSKEWAGLPNTNGVSHYAGDGLNSHTVSRNALQTVLSGLRS